MSDRIRMPNVIEFGNYKIKTEARRRYEGCQHKHFTLDDNGEIVTCDDCGKQIGAYYALRLLTEDFKFAQDRLRAAQARIDQGVGTRAAKVVEEAWASRNMVPVCPHCGEPIYAQDGFGSVRINREIADKRREAQKGGKQ